MILVGLVLGILLLTPYVRWDALFPNPEIRWAEILRLVDEKKWDRVVREIERFEEDFPESPRVGETPFFADLCKAGHDVYSPAGNADRGLELMEQIFRCRKTSSPRSCPHAAKNSACRRGRSTGMVRFGATAGKPGWFSTPAAAASRL